MAQERLELIVDYFNIWIFVDEEIDMKEAIQIELYRQTTTPQELNNEVDGINYATNSQQNNQNKNQENLYWRRSQYAICKWTEQSLRKYSSLEKKIYLCYRVALLWRTILKKWPVSKTVDKPHTSNC